MTRTISLFSLGGAPGVTTLAMALASVWPDEAGAVLVEADSGGGDVATWRRLHTSPGLIDLAAAARHREVQPADSGEHSPLKHAQVLPGGLPVCVAPATADRSAGAVGLLAQHASVLRADHGPVTVVDLGRIAPRSPTAHLAVAADTAILVVQDEVAQLRRVKESAAAFADSFRSLRVVVTGGSDSTAEISAAVGLPVWGRLPRDEKGAAFLRGERNNRRPERRPLFKSAAALAADLLKDAAPAQSGHQPAVSPS
ncbi:hypothetical protein [Nocardiopsis ansamitocini]|uniref:MinD-like ATPase involved in chromosome partitioning or flagellar assembly n=1 Tax=Nocardiopsis ansamitocini TaxID=1670832 RepID=A0A9W6P514_9ACTN|nr:hypothetical protein [Nocardiopsis ansamitocini]GLU47470.1 hypothetical protein Nans01_18210 [Nocardiopsis ansamitocini]